MRLRGSGFIFIEAATIAAALLVAACGGSGDAASGGSSPSGGNAGQGGTNGGGASASGGGTGASTPGTGGSVSGLGPAHFEAGDLDDPSDGGTITFQQIGAPGWYPSRRDPASGQCDVVDTESCCLAHHDVAGSALTPWDQDLIMTLRGPMTVKQFAAYQPVAGEAGSWRLASAWDDRMAGAPEGLGFDGNDTESAGFAGSVGSECLVNVSTSKEFPCGSGSVPYCPAPSGPHHAYDGWEGSKLFVVLATMPHADSTKVQKQCSSDNGGNWYDAPWIGLSIGELVRAGSFSSCQCYAKDLAKGYLADGCGQFNVFEVVNDNNSYKNLEIFSTDMIGYAGYVGEGPCGPKCDASTLGKAVDLVDKSNDHEATMGAVSSPTKGPGAAFRRPEEGYRYFVILMHVASRTVQLAMIHPNNIPKSVAGVLPNLPSRIAGADVDALVDLRLPK